MVAELIQILFKEEQQAQLYPFAIPYFNKDLTIFFENSVISHLVPLTKADKIAVCSWKLRQKMRMQVKRPRELTQEIMDSEYEVLSFTNNTQYHDFFGFASQHHKNFREVFEKILHLASIKMPSKVKAPIYQNHFSAKREIYQAYVKNYLIPVMWLMNNEPEVNKMVMVDSNYSQLSKNSAATSEYLKEKIGIGFYPLAPFLLERLFSVFVHNHKINVTWL